MTDTLVVGVLGAVLLHDIHERKPIDVVLSDDRITRHNNTHG